MKLTRNTELAINLMRQLIESMKSSGFQLTKWISNDRRVISEIPSRREHNRWLVGDRRPPDGIDAWADVEDDEFVWKSRNKTLTLAKQKSMTRRGILSVVCSLFDPLGFVAPFVMKGKLLLQELCRQKMGWDGMKFSEKEIRNNGIVGSKIYHA